MRRRCLAVAFPLSLMLAACSFPTGGGGGHHGGSCTATNFLNDDFHGGLANWTPTVGTAAISNDIGNPPPSTVMVNAGMASNRVFPDSCGVTVSVDLRRDTGFAIIKIVATTRVAQLAAFDTALVYRLCVPPSGSNPGGCLVHKVSITAPDTTWHRYRFVFVHDSAKSRWYRDGVLADTLDGVSSAGNLQLILGVFPTDNAGTGPSRGYFDNIIATGP